MRFWVMESNVVVKMQPYTERDMPPATATLTINMGDDGEKEAVYFKIVEKIIDLINEVGVKDEKKEA